MKMTLLFVAVALIVAAASAFSPKFNVTGWYKVSGTDFSGTTDQANCAITNTNNCSITDGSGVKHTPVYDAEANIGDEAHVLKFP
jgi:type 1 fimbria pilin